MSTPQNNSQENALIRVENLKVYYPIKGGIINHTTGYTKAVDGVSFSIMEGEILGLVGESGCGKSTIGRQLVGLERPTEGKIFYEGKDLSLLKKGEIQKIRTQLQMVFQDPYSSLNPRKHIYEILAQPMLYHGIATRETVEKDMVRILDMVGLSRNVLGRYPHEFSGGQRQRIGIARALSLNPRFIVCDEPVSALDVSIQAQILNLLKQLQQDLGLTYMFITHDLSVVNYFSDEIMVMYLGKVVEHAPSEKLFEHPTHPYTKALLKSIPILGKGANQDINPIKGSTPDPYKRPPGCQFEPRCDYACEECKKAMPDEHMLGGTHMVRCTRYQEVMKDGK